MGERRRPTDEEIHAQLPRARARGRYADVTDPRATSARYDPETGRIEVELRNGCAFAFPPSLLPELRYATPEQIARVQVEAAGDWLRWESLDVDHHVWWLLGKIAAGSPDAPWPG